MFLALLYKFLWFQKGNKKTSLTRSYLPVISIGKNCMLYYVILIDLKHCFFSECTMSSGDCAFANTLTPICTASGCQGT